MDENYLPKIGITVGDINGIGMEVILKTLVHNKNNKFFIPIIYGSGKHLSKFKNTMGMNDWQFQTIKSVSQANPKGTNLINCLNDDYFEYELGVPSAKSGKLAFDSLERATKDILNNEIDALVTAPINKDTMQNDAFKFPGHTEYLADAAKSKDYLMFMISETLRMGVVTGHIPLEKVKSSITKKAILDKLKSVKKSLIEDFDIKKPKIAILGLNPHAGENGLLGKEEQEIIVPALKEFKKDGNLVFGPFPTDGFFASNAWKEYDAVLALYHDQGLTPFKMIAFETGVNFTAGLPFVRTSPDHGTAYDIAGKNVADAGSFMNAVFAAMDIVKKRKERTTLKENALDSSKIREVLNKKSTN
jgi:4-hydroxythreonine-4-phosphate dehydrogenase